MCVVGQPGESFAEFDPKGAVAAPVAAAASAAAFVAAGFANAWASDLSGSGSSAGSSVASASSSRGSGAAYTGAQAITFNFYNQGNVVGSGGLVELAHLLRDILVTEERYA